jgi:hypothetical protein
VSSGASTGASTGGSGGAAGRQTWTSRTAQSAFGSAIGSSAAYRASQQSPSLVGLPSPNSLALPYGAFIVPVDGRANRFGLLGLSELGLSGADIFSLLGFPDFLRQGRAAAQRRAGSGLPDLQSVLGQQATIGGVGDGGDLTFGPLPLLALAFVLFSSLLLVGAVLPPGVIAHTPLSAARFARFRQPLALAAIAILLPVALVALAAALS